MADRKDFRILKAEYIGKQALYYQGQPDFEEVVDTINGRVKRSQKVRSLSVIIYQQMRLIYRKSESLLHSGVNCIE